MKKSSIIILLALVFLCACAPNEALFASGNGIEVYQVSIRLLSGEMPAAGYMLVKNNGPAADKLVGAQADFAGSVMLHQSTVDSKDVARMLMVPAIEIPAKGLVELKPGSYHLVFEGLKPGLKVGDIVTLTLQFEQAGSFPMQVSLTDL